MVVTGLVLGYLDVYDPAQKWVSTMGRCKYLTSVYVATVETNPSLSLTLLRKA